MRILQTVLSAILIQIATISQSFAHGDLTSAIPAINGIVAVSPSQLELKFSEALTVKFSGVNVAGPANSPVGIGKISFANKSKRVLIVPILTPLVAGTYTVHWHFLETNGHRFHGRYTFTVKS